MTSYPYSIDIDDHISSAKTTLGQFKIRHLPVREGDRLVGVITARDIDVAENCGIDTSIGSDIRVRKLHSKDVYVVAPNETIINVLNHMADHNTGSALIARDGKLMGIFTCTDACRYCVGLLMGAKRG
jgi:acetoin utilization protein AcuB